MSALTGLFATLLDLSLAASLVAGCVLLVRQTLRRAPRVFSYALWAIVFFRLVCPVSFTTNLSVLGLMPRITAAVGGTEDAAAHLSEPDTAAATTTATDASPATPAGPVVRPTPTLGAMQVLSLIWLAGVAVLMARAGMAYARLGHRLAASSPCGSGVFTTDAVSTAFVYGLIRPRIYVPAGVPTTDLPYILEHERTHIRRGDHLLKPLAYFAVVLHWFNPLAWLSFVLMVRDMELSCDEATLGRLGPGGNRRYAEALLAQGMEGPRSVATAPVAFGECRVKDRIRNVLNYRRPTVWVIAIALTVLCIAAVVLLGNPGQSATGPQASPSDERATEIARLVEDSLTTIMSEPKTSSNPQDYIAAHPRAYEDIKKLGDAALDYMLSQFSVGNAKGLRGAVMVRLCQDILGPRATWSANAASPQEWYWSLRMADQTKLPHFQYSGNDPLAKLVYGTEIERLARDLQVRDSTGFAVVAPHIFGSYEEDDKLKVFATTYGATYQLFGSTAISDTGGVVPAAITYARDAAGNWVLEDYRQARDGSEFGPSIREFCTMPVSGKEIPGLASRMLKHYGNYKDIRDLLRANVYQHLVTHGITDPIISAP